MIQIRNGLRHNIYASVTIDGVRYPNTLDRTLWEKLGITEVDEPAEPAGFRWDTHTRDEIDEAPYVVYSKRPADEVARIASDRAQQKIADLEAATLLPRPSRDFMLAMMVQLAAQQGVSEPDLYARNPGYRKVKDLDEEIKALREAL